MKKVLFIGGLAMLALVSCKKTKSCVCTITGGGATSQTAFPVEGNKSDRKEACSAYETQIFGAQNAAVTGSCEVD